MFVPPWPPSETTVTKLSLPGDGVEDSNSPAVTSSVTKPAEFISARAESIELPDRPDQNCSGLTW